MDAARELPKLAPKEQLTPIDQLSVDDVLGGQSRDEDAESFGSFNTVLRGAAWASGVQMRDLTDVCTCMEVEMRQVSATSPHVVSMYNGVTYWCVSENCHREPRLSTFYQ